MEEQGWRGKQGRIWNCSHAASYVDTTPGDPCSTYPTHDSFPGRRQLPPALTWEATNYVGRTYGIGQSPTQHAPLIIK